MFTEIELIRIKTMLETRVEQDKKTLAEYGEQYSQEIRNIFNRDIFNDQALIKKIENLL